MGSKIRQRFDIEPFNQGLNECGQCDIPLLPSGTKYVGVACGNSHTILVRDDGGAAICGELGDGVRLASTESIPELPFYYNHATRKSLRLKYIACFAGGYSSVLLRDDNVAVGFGAAKPFHTVNCVATHVEGRPKSQQSTVESYVFSNSKLERIFF